MPDPNDVPTPPPADRVTEVHPVRPGISISLSDGDAGTLGLFVVDSADHLFFLTARHVLVLCSQSLFRFPDLGDDGFG